MRILFLRLTFFLLVIFPAVSQDWNSRYPSLAGQIAASSQGINTLRAQTALKEYLETNDQEIGRGMEILLRTQPPSGGENISLKLLLILAEAGRLLENDSIALALALVNGHLYKLADVETQQKITQDILQHFDFYKKILAWQKSSGFPYSLDKAPLASKLFWSDRAHALHPANDYGKHYLGETLDMATYLEMVDKIEVYEKIHTLIIENKLASQSLTETASALEDFVHQKRFYLSSMENLRDFHRRKLLDDVQMRRIQDLYNTGRYESLVNGRMHGWDELRWLNIQNRLYEQDKEFRGDCGATTAVQLGFYKAAGIAPVSMQYTDTLGVIAYSHNFPAYYHPLFRRWYSVQKLNFHDMNSRPIERNLEFYISKPMYFSNADRSIRYEKVGNIYKVFSSFYLGESTNSSALNRFLTLGISEDHMDSLLAANRTMTPGLIFNTTTAPANLSDRDGDHLPDVLETSLGTNPASPDSDMDGYADMWEIESGYLPKDSGSPGATGPLAVDGIVVPTLFQRPFSSVQDRQNDSKAVGQIYDVRSLFGEIRGDQLYLAVKFHNPVIANTLKIHSFYILAHGETDQEYWVQWSGEYRQVSKRRVPQGTDWDPVGNTGLTYAGIQDFEFIIPLSYFPGAETYKVQYHAPGIFEGKDQFVADSTENFLLLYRNGEDWREFFISPGTARWRMSDPENDNVRGINPELDVTSVENWSDSTFLFFRVAFKNFNNLIWFEGVHTLYFRAPNSKKNYWFQFWPGGYGPYMWEDGLQGKNLENVPAGFEFFTVDTGGIFRIPRSIFPDPSVLSFQYRIGGKKPDGEFYSDADVTETRDLE